MDAVPSSASQKAPDSKPPRRNDCDGEVGTSMTKLILRFPSVSELQTVRCLNRIALALPVVILSIVGCAGRPPNAKSPTVVSVNPASITVAAGSTTTFAAVFSPSSPEGGSLTWSVNPASGGTINDAGVYTASGTAGKYAVVATWTPASSSAGRKISGSAIVDGEKSTNSELLTWCVRPPGYWRSTTTNLVHQHSRPPELS